MIVFSRVIVFYSLSGSILLIAPYELEIGPTRDHGIIGAVSSLEYIYDKYGYHVLDRTLPLCIGTWEGEPSSLSANMFKGIAKLVAAFGEKMRDDIFKEKVGDHSSKEIIRTAKERRAGAAGYAEAMLIAYNKKMKYPLRWSSLYKDTNKKRHSDEVVEDDFEAEMDNQMQF